MSTIHIDPLERIRRSEYVRDTLGALVQDTSLEQRTKQREEFADRWAAWLRDRFRDRITDNFRIISPADFRVVA
jgi:hypothetical protein